MTEMDQQSSKPPPLSEMLSKFALSFRTKAIEFFAEEEDAGIRNPSFDYEEDLGFVSLVDSPEEVITGQKVVVIKPDETLDVSRSGKLVESVKDWNSGIRVRNVPVDVKVGNDLISSIIASVSSFQASYIQLQAAHMPLSEDGLALADKASVSQLRRLSDLKKFYKDLRCDRIDSNVRSPVSSCLEAQVQENQSKLRALGTVSNQLQLEIDAKDGQVAELRKELEKCRIGNAKLSKRLAMSSSLSRCEVLTTVSVFNSMLNDTVRSIHKFTKLLIGLMKNANWDLDSAASWVHPGVEYEKKVHKQYAFLSYVCLLMMKDFDSANFGIRESDEALSVRKLVDHVSTNPMDVLSRDPSCDFSRYCEKKYQELIHPTMETSIFGNLNQDKAVLNSWKSLSVFYESFIHMASSVWALHKLAFSFNPVVEIFQVESGAEYSIIYMGDVANRNTATSKRKAKVGFTVVPGFKIGKTPLQCQVYLTGVECK